MKVIGLGAGGHAKMVIETLRQTPAMEIVALLDAQTALSGHTVLDVSVVGSDADLASWMARGVEGFFVGVGMVGDHGPRRRLFMYALSLGLSPVSAIHRTAIISPSAEVGAGVTILPGAIVNAGARVGVNVIINTGAVIEHDCVIGDHAHVATGACLSGSVVVGSAAHIGTGASIRQGVRIGESAVVGAGAVVVADVADGVTVVGVPARPIRKGAHIGDTE